VYNTTRIFHIVYAALFATAGYLAYTATTNAGLPFIVSSAISMFCMAGISVLVDKIVYQPLEKRKSASNVLMISSIGAMIVIINSLAMVYGNEVKIFSSRISESFTFGELILTYNQAMQFAVCIAVLSGFLLLLKFSSFGLMTRALRDDPHLLSVLGINTVPIRTLVFAASGALVALASCLVAYDVGLDPYTGMPFLLNVIVALIIGGIGNFVAPILGNCRLLL
jgi:branched-chain amino acid transport system permease protein